MNDLVAVTARMKVGDTIVEYEVPMIMEDSLGFWPPAVHPDALHLQ